MLYTALVRATDLRGLRQLTTISAVQKFLDEDVGIWQPPAGAGIQVELHVWAGRFHALDAMPPESDITTIRP